MVNKLNSFPVFGIEWAERTEVARIQHAGNPVARSQISDEMVSFRNFVKAVGYIPGVHLVVGVALVIFALHAKWTTKNPTDESRRRQNEIIERGIATFIMGPLVFIVDAIQTIRDISLVEAYVKKNAYHVVLHDVYNTIHQEKE